MNVVKFKSGKNNSIVFCCVDRTSTYASAWTREIIKNISDYTISNVLNKGYDVLEGIDEDRLLSAANEYDYAVVFSTGTEFINGEGFFKAIENLSSRDFFLAGHVLDRAEAYYELHYQCYMINLNLYRKLGSPKIGDKRLGEAHRQSAPKRSQTNWHDDYTPTHVQSGDSIKEYHHKCHGWNILRIAFDHDYDVLVFDESVRDNKKHYYPENQEEFLKHSTYIYAKHNYCATTFVHTETTDSVSVPHKFQQVITPASGLGYLDYSAEDAKIIFYDYNPSALTYWKNHAEGQFEQIDLLGMSVDFGDIVDANLDTVFNFSNVFCYEGTAALTSLEYRLNKENVLIEHIKKIMPDAYLLFSSRAAAGFIDLRLQGKAKEFETVNIRDLCLPTWHVGDW